jgi:hypothetical protein
VNGEHRGADAHAGDFGFEGALVGAVETRDVSGCAAHVEADDFGEACGARCLGHADDATGRAREDRILAAEIARDGEAAARTHEAQALVLGEAAKLARDTVNVATQNRRQIGVCYGGVTAADEFHQRVDIVARRNLREAGAARDGGDLLLVRGIAIAVHEDDSA